MNGNSVVPAVLVLFSTVSGWAQGDVPIYRVTVIERTVRAVDYQYRTGPTKVDFRGTVLLPPAKGEATVESKRGRTEIEAKFEHVSAPTRFGREYLTYVLWAITPEGHARNLGEVLADGSDHARLRASTDLQAFGLIVTAEPYSAVRQPGDVVVMENEIRPDTLGRTEPISAKAELLPRGHYTYDVPADLTAARSNAPRLPMDQYEALLEVYQAQNAVQIAQSMGADQYAADTYAKAAQLLHDAQDLQARKAGVSSIVTAARQAAQTAEDARAIALRRKPEADLAKAQEQARQEAARAAQAEATARQAQADAAAERARLEQERAALRQADRVMYMPTTGIQEPQRAPTEAAPQVQAPLPPPADASADQKQARLRLFQQLQSALPTRDTPRGLVLTVSDRYFHSSTFDPALYGRLASVASIIRGQPGLMIEVEGHTDDRGDAVYDERLSAERAASIRNLLARQGVASSSIAARGFGKARPLASNATSAGREQNRRVEIVISGVPIGETAYWDKSYSLSPQE
jgi:outer membrane protein OmpA-like peptidoglycan-associated protein